MGGIYIAKPVVVYVSSRRDLPSSTGPHLLHQVSAIGFGVESHGGVLDAIFCRMFYLSESDDLSDKTHPGGRQWSPGEGASEQAHENVSGSSIWFWKCLRSIVGVYFLVRIIARRSMYPCPFDEAERGVFTSFRFHTENLVHICVSAK